MQDKEKRPVKDLEVLADRIVSLLRENGIHCFCHSVYERDDQVIKVTLAIYPRKLLEQLGKIEKEITRRVG